MAPVMRLQDADARAGVEPSDDALMERFCQGDEVGFEMLYQRHAESVLAFLRRMVRDPALAGEWQEGFEALPRPVTPTLVLPDGYVSRGLGALARLADLIGEADRAHG